jgi:hypothetical protein
MPAEKVTGNGRPVSHSARSRWRRTSAPCGGGEDDEEFLTAESPDDVATSDGAAQHAAERAQHLIAGRVPEIVVDLLEVVEVQHDHGIVAREPAEGTIKHAAVGEAGQQVGRCGLG